MDRDALPARSGAAGIALLALLWAWPKPAGGAPGPIQLRDVTRETGITFIHTDGSSGKRYIVETVCCGLATFDFDNDGNLDIFIACGHLHDNVELFDTTTSYHARNILLRNTGGGRFANVSDESGDGLLLKLSSRGAAFDDLDNDGRVDAVILNSRREPTVLRNESAGGSHWLLVRLRGTRSNRDGVGAHVKVTAGGLVQVSEVHSGRGYQSHYGTRLHFGLGKRDRADRIEVRWIGGGVDSLENVPADQILTIVEGSTKAGGGNPPEKK